jgi:hypothetical protein
MFMKKFKGDCFRKKRNGTSGVSLQSGGSCISCFSPESKMKFFAMAGLLAYGQLSCLPVTITVAVVGELLLWQKRRYTATGIAPDLHRIPFSSVFLKFREAEPLQAQM